MKLIIAGGRDFDDYKILKREVLLFIDELGSITEIVSGKAKGADTLGEKFAKEFNIPIKGFPADWKNIEGKPDREIGENKYGKYWKLAGKDRNRKMAEYADALIAFWNGSSGTRNMIEWAGINRLKTKIVKYD